jgi:hypothetical protein
MIGVGVLMCILICIVICHNRINQACPVEEKADTDQT